MVLTDRDYIEFLSSITDRGPKDIFPPVIRNVLSNNILLTIGYSLEDITFRLILRTLSGLNRTRGVSVVYRKNLPEDKRNLATEYLEKYTQQAFSLRVFYGTMEDFVIESKNRLKKFQVPESIPSRPRELPKNYHNKGNWGI